MASASRSKSEFKVFGETFRIDSRYEPVKALGKGAYGIVCAAKNRETGAMVAIKRVSPMCSTDIDGKHTLREIRMMRYLGRHENVISLKDLVVSESEDAIYVFMSLADSDLHKIIVSKQTLTDAHFKHFMFQLLRGLRFTHRNGVIHRDLKPANLLVTKDCSLRISDFGLSRLAPEDEGDLMTEHVVTRWYRAPELMLSADGCYTETIDTWSCGCIFAELILRRPLFPGKDFKEQLRLIFDVFGTPKPEELDYVKSKEALDFVRSMGTIAPKDPTVIFAAASEQALDLMLKMLTMYPPHRVTVDDAMAHAYFDDVRDQYEDEDPTLPAEFEFAFEKMDLSLEDYRAMIREEALSFKRERQERSRRRRDRHGRDGFTSSSSAAGSSAAASSASH